MKCPFFVVLVDGDVHVIFTFPVNCDDVPMFQYFLEMVDVVTAFELDTKIVHDKCEGVGCQG